MFEGVDLGGHMAWRAAKPGFNALTETDQTNLSFSSDWLRTGLVHEVGTTDGSAYVFFDPLPFIPHVWPLRRDGSKIFATEAAWRPYNMNVSGPFSGYWPIDIRRDRFIMNYYNETPTPHVFPYVIFKVPVPGT